MHSHIGIALMKITKQSGEQEEFSKNKFCKSLREAGADKELVDKTCNAVVREIKPGMTTSDIFRKASRLLVRQNTRAAARYNLKRGINDLGPAGFLFERYLETLLRAEGFSTRRNRHMRGKCISHEVDIVAHKGRDHALVEAKYRNDPGTKTHVDVVMYADARLQDISKRQKGREKRAAKHRMWVVTNTKFTTSSTKYARCRNITLTGWDYPKGESLGELVERHVLYPITVLPSLNTYAREQFAKRGLMLAQDIAPHSQKDLEKKFQLKADRSKKILAEAHALVYGEEKSGAKGNKKKKRG